VERAVTLSVLEIVALVAVVGLAGFGDAIAGGGGLISLPAYFAVGLPPHVALATNKFSSCCGTLVAVVRFWRAGKVHLPTGLSATAGALAGSACGTRVALLLSPEAVHTVLLVLVPCVAVVFLARAKLFPERAAGDVEVRHALAKAALVGLTVGFYDGFFGPGTGTFLGIAFHFALRMDLVSASGNARLTNLASNAGSLTVFLLNGRVLFPLALMTAAGGIAGNLLGSQLAVRKGDRVIRPLMVVMLVLLLGYIVKQRMG